MIGGKKRSIDLREVSMPKVRKAKKPRTGKAPKTQSERLERSGKSNPLKSKYKRKKKVPV